MFINLLILLTTFDYSKHIFMSMAKFLFLKTVIYIII